MGFRGWCRVLELLGLGFACSASLRFMGSRVEGLGCLFSLRTRKKKEDDDGAYCWWGVMEQSLLVPELWGLQGDNCSLIFKLLAPMVHCCERDSVQ